MRRRFRFSPYFTRICFATCYILLLLYNNSARAADSIPHAKLVIRDIFITGNKVTKKEIILRELAFKTGDTIFYEKLPDLLSLSHRQLTNTALFHQIKLADSVAETDVFIKIELTERWYIIPELVFSLADRNFNEWWRNKDLYRITYGARLYVNNFRGRNERLTFDVVLGWQQSLGMQYRIPYLNRNKTLGLQLTLKHQQGHELPYQTINNRLQFFRYDPRLLYKKESAETEFTYRRRLRTKHIFRLGTERFVIDDTISKYKNPDFLYKGRSRITSLYSAYQFVYDSRDYFFYPSKGFLFTAGINNNILDVFSENIGFYTLWTDLDLYHSFTKRFIYGGGIKIQRSLHKELPFVYRSSLGYRSLVRGYEHYVIDGNGYGIINNELRFKTVDKIIHLPFIPFSQFNRVPLKIYLKGFADAGIATYPTKINNNTFINKALAGYGAGLDFITYYDKILRIEYSFNNIGESELFLHYVVAF